MLLAEFEVFHNRGFSPTRRLALGRRNLPLDPPPGYGVLLLGGLAAVAGEELERDDRAAVRRLLSHLEHGDRVTQPQVRHRFQTDTHGLARTWAGLRSHPEGAELDVDGNVSPLQMALLAAYAAGQLPAEVRPRAFDVLRRGLAWRGPIDATTFRHLAGDDDLRWASTAFADPRLWALDVLVLAEERAGEKDVRRRFRQLLREAHPDHGAESADAADRIADLAEARKILL
ncbi:MAG TPA: J domain-containing protein, partial [Acidimicrobiales bacterium]|nr:J domain-containing protein [Acidimicrobiales bacterium]